MDNRIGTRSITQDAKRKKRSEKRIQKVFILFLASKTKQRPSAMAFILNPYKVTLDLYMRDGLK